jgi:hypothetical protein
VLCWNEFGELAEVLGGGGEEELVLRSVRSSKAQAIEPRARLRWANSISTFFRRLELSV